MPLLIKQRIALIVTLVLVVMVLVSSGLVLLPFIIALLLALLLHPVHRRMRAVGLSASIAAATNTFVATLATVGLVFGVVPFFIDDAIALVETLFRDAYKIFDWLDEIWGSWLPGMQPLSEMLEERMAELAPTMETVTPALMGVLNTGGFIVFLLILAILVPMALFFFLKEGRAFREAAVSLVPVRYQAEARDFMLTVGEGLGNYLRGQGIVCFWQAVFHAVLLAIIGLQFGVLIGILTGIAAIVPILGNWTMFAVAMLVAFMQFETWLPILAVIAVFALANVLDTFFLVPYFIGSRIRMHPLLMILALLLGSQLFGLVGALLALPATTVIVTASHWIWSRYEQTDVYAVKPTEEEALAEEEEARNRAA